MDWDDKEQVREYRRKWYESHREQIREWQKENAEQLKKNHKEWRKKNPWVVPYYNAKKRCTNPRDDKYKYYGGNGIEFLLTRDDVKQIWHRDNAIAMKKPSIDRLDSKKNYEISNIRFIELSKNCGRELRKPVIQYNLEGKFIKLWVSQSEASKKTKIHHNCIFKCCSGKRKTAGGYKWALKEKK